MSRLRVRIRLWSLRVSVLREIGCADCAVMGEIAWVVVLRILIEFAVSLCFDCAGVVVLLRWFLEDRVRWSDGD